MTEDFEAYAHSSFDKWKSDADPLFFKSLKYSFFSGGKRFRPRFILSLGSDLGVSLKSLFPAALALELIHTYSLVHDDLPAMDDDLYRRDKLTHHAKYGEASAVLAGDALQALAFQVLGESYSGEALKKLVVALAKCSGMHGMVGGQVLDCLTDKRDLKIFNKIHLLKTAKLFEFCAHSVGVVGGFDKNDLDKISNLGAEAGLLFQLQDDLLDEAKKDERPEENILFSVDRETLVQTIEEKKKVILSLSGDLGLNKSSIFLNLMQKMFERTH